MSEKIYKDLDKSTRFFRFTLPLVILAYPFYLWARSPGKNGSHYHPDSFCTSLKRKTMSSLLLLVGLQWLLCLSVSASRWVQFKYSLLSLFSCLQCSLLSSINLMILSKQEWSYLRGGLTTLDRDYRLINNIHHDVGTHVIHHLFPEIPHYHLVEATEAAKPVLGKYYREPDKSGPLPFHLLEILAKSIKKIIM